MEEDLEKLCCGRVNVSEFVNLVMKGDFEDYGVDDRNIEKVADMYRHVLYCDGCFNGLGSLLEEFSIGNNSFNHKRRIKNMTYIEEFYPTK